MHYYHIVCINNLKHKHGINVDGGPSMHYNLCVCVYIVRNMLNK